MNTVQKRHSMLTVLLVFIALASGCKGVNRLMNGDDVKAPFVPAVGGATEIGPVPNFDVPTPSGFSRTVFHDRMPADGRVSITVSAQSSVAVFLKDFSGNWFMLQDKQIPAYWYSYDATTGVVEYKCKDLSWMKEFCIYEYTAVAP